MGASCWNVAMKPKPHIDVRSSLWPPSAGGVEGDELEDEDDRDRDERNSSRASSWSPARRTRADGLFTASLIRRKWAHFLSGRAAAAVALVQYGEKKPSRTSGRGVRSAPIKVASPRPVQFHTHAHASN
jgi:hypothetical protein